MQDKGQIGRRRIDGTPMMSTWSEVKTFALSLGLPEVVETTSWGNPMLKAHGKNWVWWSPYIDAALFKCAIEEREMLQAADPATFLHHDHYAKHNVILVAAGHIDEGWAEARLRQTWRDAAPKRVHKEWDAAHGLS